LPTPKKRGNLLAAKNEGAAFKGNGFCTWPKMRAQVGELADPQGKALLTADVDRQAPPLVAGSQTAPSSGLFDTIGRRIIKRGGRQRKLETGTGQTGPKKTKTKANSFDTKNRRLCEGGRGPTQGVACGAFLCGVPDKDLGARPKDKGDQFRAAKC